MLNLLPWCSQRCRCNALVEVETPVTMLRRCRSSGVEEVREISLGDSLVLRWQETGKTRRAVGLWWKSLHLGAKSKDWQQARPFAPAVERQAGPPTNSLLWGDGRAGTQVAEMAESLACDGRQ